MVYSVMTYTALCRVMSRDPCPAPRVRRGGLEPGCSEGGVLAAACMWERPGTGNHGNTHRHGSQDVGGVSEERCVHQTMLCLYCVEGEAMTGPLAL